MAGRKHVRERSLRVAGPFLVLGRHLGGDDDATGPDVGFQHLADEALAVSIPVRQRGIEEADSAVERLAQGLTPLAVVDAAPLGAAQPPAPVAEFADRVACRTEGPAFHVRSSDGNIPAVWFIHEAWLGTVRNSAWWPKDWSITSPASIPAPSGWLPDSTSWCGAAAGRATEHAAPEHTPPLDWSARPR